MAFRKWQESDDELLSDASDDLLAEQVGRLINDVVRLFRELREVGNRLAILESRASPIAITSPSTPEPTLQPERSLERTDSMTQMLL